MNKLLIIILTTLMVPPVASQDLERIHPQEEGLSWAPHFSRIVAHRGGRTIYIAPMAATDGNGKIVGEGDLEVQARHIYKKLRIALEAAGAKPEHVVSHRQYVVKLSAEDAPILGN